MTVSFLCSMLRDDLKVFLESNDHIIITEAGKLRENNSIVKDFQFMASEGFIIKAKDMGDE